MSTTTYLADLSHDDKVAICASRVRAFRKIQEEKIGKGETTEEEAKTAIASYRLEQLTDLALTTSADKARKPSLVSLAVQVAERSRVTVWDKGTDRKTAVELEATEERPIVPVPGYTKGELGSIAKAVQGMGGKLSSDLLTNAPTAFGIRNAKTGKVRLVRDFGTVAAMNTLLARLEEVKAEHGRRSPEFREVVKELRTVGQEVAQEA